MRQVVIARPFAGGYRSDVPDYALNPNECAYAQDLIYPFGIAQQRWGWSHDGTTADVAANLVGVDRTRYVIPGTTATVTSDSAGDIWTHNPSSAGTKIWDNPDSLETTWVPRCVYGGDLILCAQDGQTPLIRFAGSALTYAQSTVSGGSSSATWNLPAGSSTLTGVSAGDRANLLFPDQTDIGSFVTFDPYSSTALALSPIVSSHVLSLTTAKVSGIDTVRSVTLEAMRNSNGTTAMFTANGDKVRVLPVGFAYPAVSVYDSGTITSVGTAPSTGGNTWTFAGASFNGARILTPTITSAPTGAAKVANAAYGDALLMLNPTNGSNHEISSISAVDISNDQVSTFASSSTHYTNAQYRILRRLPFKDATVHKNSFIGTGVKQYPNRVYVAPPLWNMSLPPGAIDPHDPTKGGGATTTGFADLDEFLLAPIDVPSRFDGDPVVALLSTNSPLLVLKGNSVYGIYGTYPSYEQTIIAFGSGCIDLRSAISVDGVAYWAGKDGVFMYAGGQIQALTGGKIDREWQALMRGYVAGTSYVTTALVAGHLVVSVGGLSNAATGEAKVGPDSSNPSERTYVYDMRSQQWTSRISNAKMRNLSSVRVPGEVPSIFGVSDDRQGQVMDLTPMITGTKCTNRASQTLVAADPVDAAGTGPRMQAWSSASLAQANGIEGEARLLDLSLHTTLTDTAVTPTAAVDVATAHGDSLDSPATAVVAQGTITGDNVDRVDRTKFRINRTGRLHQVRVDLDTTPSTTTKAQIPEMVASFRDNRRMT
jgi:hypothetical protein